ncbi:Sialic acid-binding Ig-like lectin 14 [Myotis brandtii]|uniref:Sialic acid-binding Ig-like lectin 14 n=1 Tax=Myotis brandtii TaxID=109478 RepID=S7N9L4_MYOBR|nr:Sialic acid-binding Ig-like lectin 14 [Myotis brandtii]
MVPLLLLLLLWGESLEEQPGFELRVQESVTVQEGLCVHVPSRRSDATIYVFRMERESMKYTYKEKMLNLQVTALTEKPHIRIREPLESGRPTKEDSIWHNLPVASNDPNKPTKGETQGRFLLPDSRNNNCSLHIRDARRSDATIYVFRMERESMKYTYKEKMLNLQVTALTEKPHIRIREPLESGRPTQLACSLPGACKGGRPLTFSWEGAAVGSLDPQNCSSSELTFTPRPGDHGTNLTCQVKR